MGSKAGPESPPCSGGGGGACGGAVGAVGVGGLALTLALALALGLVLARAVLLLALAVVSRWCCGWWCCLHCSCWLWCLWWAPTAAPAGSRAETKAAAAPKAPRPASPPAPPCSSIPAGASSAQPGPRPVRLLLVGSKRPRASYPTLSRPRVAGAKSSRRRQEKLGLRRVLDRAPGVLLGGLGLPRLLRRLRLRRGLSGCHASGRTGE